MRLHVAPTWIYYGPTVLITNNFNHDKEVTKKHKLPPLCSFSENDPFFPSRFDPWDFSSSPECVTHQSQDSQNYWGAVLRLLSAAFLGISALWRSSHLLTTKAAWKTFFSLGNNLPYNFLLHNRQNNSQKQRGRGWMVGRHLANYLIGGVVLPQIGSVLGSFLWLS